MAEIDERVTQFLELAGVQAVLILDADEYQRRSGRPANARRAGEVFLGATETLLYINPHDQTLADIDRLIAHEVMHLRWPSYGHKEIGFRRAQELLDAVPGPRVPG